jgi:hypothetical protein
VNQAIAQMDEVTQQNAALVEQASAATASMEQQTVALLQELRTFKLDAQLQQTQVAPALRTAPTSTQPLPLAAASRKAKAGDDWEEF